jgi:hypothetical protein
MLLRAAWSMAVVAALAAASATKVLDFSKHDESLWTAVREDRFPSPGAFVQKEGHVVNDFPPGTSEADLYSVKDGVGYAMRLLKDVQAKDGRAELELELVERAAPSIVFRVQMPDLQVHGPLYSLVVFNHTTEKREYQGVNLWKWTGQAGQPGFKNWQRLAYWYVPIPREKRLKLGVEFRGDLFRVFLDGKEIGGMRDTAALPAGGLGVVAMEGVCRFYSFSFTPF